MLDILFCINKIPGDIFKLEQMYYFEKSLSQKHPNNRFIKAKIRQQL
jgi:type II restriction enzyme